MTLRKKPTRAERKARKEERHEIVRSIMQEPDDVVFFPVAFGRIAMSAAVWGSVALGVLALGVLASAVFLMRDEIAGLGKQLQQKDVDLVILSGELQKVRDQMFGEQEQAVQQGIRVRLVNAETGVASAIPGVTLKDTPFPHRQGQGIVNGKYLYWKDEEGILRVNLEDGTTYRAVTQSDVASVAVSSDGARLAYLTTKRIDEMGSTQTIAVVMQLSGRGDPVELTTESPLRKVAGEVGERLVGFSKDGSELLWTVTFADSGTYVEELHRVRIANGIEAPVVNTRTGGWVGYEPGDEWDIFLGLSPDGTTYAMVKVKPEEGGSTGLVIPLRIVLKDAVTGRERDRYVFPTSGRTPARMSGSWTLDGASIVLLRDDEVSTLPTMGSSGPVAVTRMAVETEESPVMIVRDGRFVFMLVPSLVGSYAFRNLSTDAVSSGDGPFSGILGWSSDLNAVVLLENTHE